MMWSTTSCVSKRCVSLLVPSQFTKCVRLLLDFFRFDSLRRNYGETMRHWTRRSTLQYSKVGQALNASDAEINK